MSERNSLTLGSTERLELKMLYEAQCSQLRDKSGKEISPQWDVLFTVLININHIWKIKWCLIFEIKKCLLLKKNNSLAIFSAILYLQKLLLWNIMFTLGIIQLY